MSAQAPPLVSTDTRAAALQRLAEACAAAGIEAPRREARLLLLAALAITPEDLLLQPDAPLGQAAQRLQEVAGRRLAREPLSRIVGRRAFFDVDFDLNEATLDPRPDTEILVEATLEHAARRGLASRPIRIIDLGVGSGAILTVLLARLPLATGVGADLSERALAAARHNLERHLGPGRADFLRSDWFDAIEGTFDIIVSNPPYIASADIAALDPEVVRFDPVLALDGGSDGLDAYRILAGGIAARLHPGGFAALECGAGQSAGLSRILAMAGLETQEVRRDLAGHDRVVVVSRR
jgi:release factor glutamine methyltransferase